MKIFWEKFKHNLRFTENEKKVIIFLISTFTIGATIKLFGINFSQTENVFDYSQVENEFEKSSISETISFDSNQLKNKDTVLNEKKVTNKLIDINVATIDELTQLPSIGISTANKIVEYRNKNGKFKLKEDLKKIKGIGEKKFEKLKKLITIKTN